MIEFALDDPAVIADPYPFYARLRDEAPVQHLPRHRVWVVSRYDDVLVALRDSTRFSSDLTRIAGGLGGSMFNPALRIPAVARPVAARLPWPRVLLTSDPPDHTVLRRKVSRAFTPRMMSTWEARIREIAARLVADLDEDADLVRGLAAPLPTTVIAEMMGIADHDHDQFKAWSDDMVYALTGPGSVVRLATSAVAINLFFRNEVRRRRRHPGDDLISLLLAGDPTEALTTRELTTFCILLLAAGNETTTNLVANTMAALFAHPDELRRLEADPTLAGAAVEEALRYDSPGQGLLRVTTTDVTFAGTTIPTGSNVFPLVGSANRDPRHWTDPDVYAIDRQPDDHLAFGTGIHFCIGSALARLEARVAIETLLRAASVRPAGEPERIVSPVLRGLRRLPVHVERANLGRSTESRSGT